MTYCLTDAVATSLQSLATCYWGWGVPMDRWRHAEPAPDGVAAALQPEEPLQPVPTAGDWTMRQNVAGLGRLAVDLDRGGRQCMRWTPRIPSRGPGTGASRLPRPASGRPGRRRQ